MPLFSPWYLFFFFFYTIVQSVTTSVLKYKGLFGSSIFSKYSGNTLVSKNIEVSNTLRCLGPMNTVFYKLKYCTKTRDFCHNRNFTPDHFFCKLQYWTKLHCPGTQILQYWNTVVLEKLSSQLGLKKR